MVATLGYSLRSVNTTAQLVVLYLPDKVSKQALCVATASGFVAHPVQRIPPPENGHGMNAHFLDQYTKLSLWSPDTLPRPAHTVVYLDSDTLVLRNFDELFGLPYTFAAVPDGFLDRRGFVTSFNAGVMLLRPDATLFQAMLLALPLARYPPEYAEQAFLNQFFATDVLRLPYAYNGNLALKKRSLRMWEGIQDEMRIIHYTITKPFISHKWKNVGIDKLEERIEQSTKEDGGLFKDEILQWAEMWREFRAKYSHQLDICRML